MTSGGNSEKMYVQTAGLVICCAFLEKCFTILDYLNEDLKFKDEKSLNRAVYLLHFIATGNSNLPNGISGEYLLVMPKILCGMPVNHSIDENITLSEKEIETALTLLNAIITNWDKMSNSTVENLRGSFLIREGIVSVGNNSYELNVQSKSFDILLSFLPWNIAIIELPWMTKSIDVNWEHF